ncbi:MAG: hypothetical protein J2P19_18450 [Pseudonocardia sp.]|nr:hypothetical protein [Pseudonocardia sp.]
MTALCFLDTETTSLRPDRRAWEIAVIRRDNGHQDQRVWYVAAADLDLGNADPMAPADRPVLPAAHRHDR